jgi:hypothetical protein
MPGGLWGRAARLYSAQVDSNNGLSYCVRKTGPKKEVHLDAYSG